jgi:hypothetical protein
MLFDFDGNLKGESQAGTISGQARIMSVIK